ncbi:LuxR family transcriptional regulator [Amycolatopsis rhabdoformis]|uniref:LuxR family transcriptional regulator n=1 Tax=Amycolatopsis rhabdoformis TaxID=1448059 RepID=A0ABZ1HVH8_9PSEU|nr:LuxR family transcriptional regulator [Amycolatopsis rhabdoformis]WSE26302.1 LuxR family transcriptional regulator [Amycolatopsis rhabdoformis]
MNLFTLAETHTGLATQAPARRSAVTVHGGHEHALRQTVMALSQGEHLHETEHPGGETTVLVLHGNIRLVTGAQQQSGAPGDYFVPAAGRHRIEAETDAAILFTHVVPR